MAARGIDRVAACGYHPRPMTTIPRLHVPADLAPGVTVAATAGQAHYLGTVLRHHAGDAVRLFNGRDGEFQARIATLRRAELTLTVETQLRPQRPDADLWLAFAPLKRDATDLVMQKATELGVAEIWPVLTEHTNAARVNHDRLVAIAIEAAEQCERLTLPSLHPPRRLLALLAEWPADRRLYAAIERADLPRLAAARHPAGLLIGPEGGFAPAELDALHRHPFVTPVSLGPRILRAETASIVGLALLQAQGCG